jgi:hypothetical protein
MPESSEIPSLWRPFHTPIFRNLLLASVVSDIGAFMQTMGAAWLMVSLKAGPMYVALTQTASALPFFIFALPAGAIGDIVDRRKLILFTESWMVAVALVPAAVTLAGFVSPLPLLILTFALSAGDAFESPSWRAVLPDLVKKEDLPTASALNGIEFNFARAVGPGLARSPDRGGGCPRASHFHFGFSGSGRRGKRGLGRCRCAFRHWCRSFLCGCGNHCYNRIGAILTLARHNRRPNFLESLATAHY